MPALKFPYYRFSGGGAKDPLARHSIYRPLIPITLVGPHGGIDVLALVDTGSDDCLFDHQLADAVGIEWSTGPSYEISGVNGGKIPVHFKSARYDISGHRFAASLGFATLPLFKAILGQSGFFESVIASFDHGNNRLEIRF